MGTEHEEKEQMSGDDDGPHQDAASVSKDVHLLQYYFYDQLQYFKTISLMFKSANFL